MPGDLGADLLIGPEASVFRIVANLNWKRNLLLENSRSFATGFVERDKVS
jgi:hypothetical protein